MNSPAWSGTEFPLDSDGNVYHLQIGPNSTSRLVLSVGDSERGKRLTYRYLHNITEHVSSRGFVIYNGYYKDCFVTIVVTGMGFAMMDFVVREIRATLPKGMELIIVRLGTCGTHCERCYAGDVVVPKATYTITLNYAAYRTPDDQSLPRILISPPVDCDAKVYATLTDCLKSTWGKLCAVGKDKKFEDSKTARLGRVLLPLEADNRYSEIKAGGLGGSASGFYHEQGRASLFFEDGDTSSKDLIMDKYPNTYALEMEAGHLCHLAAISKAEYKVRMAFCCVVLADRSRNVFLGNKDKYMLEYAAGQACLDALVSLSVEGETPAEL